LIPASLQTLLGLCQRAGKAISGEFAVEQALRRRKADLLILAEDASENTQERFINLAQRSGVPCYRFGTRDELGAVIGKGHRATIAVQSRDFAKGIVSALTKEGLAPLTGRGCSCGTESPRI